MIKITAIELLDYAFKHSGLKTKFVAEKALVSPEAITSWLRGDYEPKYFILCCLLEVMGFDLAELTIKLRSIKELETMRL